MRIIMVEIPSLLSNWKELIFRMQSSGGLLVEMIILCESQVRVDKQRNDLMESMHIKVAQEEGERSHAISGYFTYNN